jgi:hypothetical protein
VLRTLAPILLIAVARTATALPLTPGNLVIMTGDDGLVPRIAEYTPQGGVVQEWVVPWPLSTGGPRPLREDVYSVTVDAELDIHVLNGRESRFLSTLDPVTGTWSHRPWPRMTFSYPNTDSPGLAAFDGFAFGSEWGTNLAEQGGLLRMDLTTGQTTEFGTSHCAFPTRVCGFVHLSLGQDGRLYAESNRQDRSVFVFDPTTLALVDQLDLQLSAAIGSTRTDTAATVNGEIFSLFLTGALARYDADGNLLDVLSLPYDEWEDLEISDQGVIAVASHARLEFGNDNLILTDPSLDTFTSFKIGPGNGIYIAFVPTPEPSTAILLLTGLGALNLQRRILRRR